LECKGCHTQPAAALKLKSDCVSCHSQDDVHVGQFGTQCQKCHDTRTFKSARPH
jgi:hypothetical protein